MKVTVFGTGYVGLVQGAVLADAGHHVLCVDVDAQKVAALQAGRIPIHEPGLDGLVQRNQQLGRLHFTTDAAEGVRASPLIFLAVGTPPDEDGSADLQYVLAVARTIATHMDGPRTVINKSTVPVGTADQVADVMQQVLAARGASHAFDVVSNPEFLKEGAAVADCQRPDRIVIGTRSARAEAQLRELYAPFNRNHDKIVVMDVRSAELTKYAANAMLATKISFINEVANLAERLGADIEAVRRGIGSDPRIGYHFIYPGVGYGGSCFPKDVKALIHTAQQAGFAPTLLNAVEARNQAQREVLAEKIAAYYAGDVDNVGSAGHAGTVAADVGHTSGVGNAVSHDSHRAANAGPAASPGQPLQGKTVALWGLAFKPNTDDMREAPSRNLLAALWRMGARVQAHDPVAMPEARRLFGERADLHLVDTPMAALQGADCLAIVTEWQSFRVPDFDAVRAALSDPVIFDGRNLYEPAVVARHGLRYVSIGRPVAAPDVA